MAKIKTITAGACQQKAHLFLQQARRELPERKPSAEAVRVRVQKKADRRDRRVLEA